MKQLNHKTADYIKNKHFTFNKYTLINIEQFYWNVTPLLLSFPKRFQGVAQVVESEATLLLTPPGKLLPLSPCCHCWYKLPLENVERRRVEPDVNLLV